MLGRDVFIKKSAPYRARRVCYDRKERIPFLRFGFAFTKLTFSGARVCPPKPNDVIEIVIDGSGIELVSFLLWVCVTIDFEKERLVTVLISFYFFILGNYISVVWKTNNYSFIHKNEFILNDYSYCSNFLYVSYCDYSYYNWFWLKRIFVCLFTIICTIID